MNLHRKILATATVATLAATGIASAADAPIVSKQEFIAGAAPFTIPGTGVKKGDYMGAKGVLVYRDVTLEGTQKVRLTLKAPKGKTLKGLAVPEGSKIGFAVVGKTSYVGKKQVTVRAWVHGGVAGEKTARIGALAR